MNNHQTKCHHPNCEITENLEYLDYTVTGIGDIRYYCQHHIHQHKRFHEIQDTKRWVSYLESEVINFAEKMNESLNKMKDAKRKLKNLEGMNIQQYKESKEKADETN